MPDKQPYPADIAQRFIAERNELNQLFITSQQTSGYPDLNTDKPILANLATKDIVGTMPSSVAGTSALFIFNAKKVFLSLIILSTGGLIMGLIHQNSMLEKELAEVNQAYQTHNRQQIQHPHSPRPSAAPQTPEVKQPPQETPAPQNANTHSAIQEKKINRTRTSKSIPASQKKQTSLFLAPSKSPQPNRKAASIPTRNHLKSEIEIFGSAKSAFQQGHYIEAEKQFENYLDIYQWGRFAKDAQYYLIETAFQRGKLKETARRARAYRKAFGTKNARVNELLQTTLNSSL